MSSTVSVSESPVVFKVSNISCSSGVSPPEATFAPPSITLTSFFTFEAGFLFAVGWLIFEGPASVFPFGSPYFLFLVSTKGCANVTLLVVVLVTGGTVPGETATVPTGAVVPCAVVTAS